MDTMGFVLDNSTAVLVIIIFAILTYLIQRGRKSPPGPRYIPFLGIIPGIVGDVTGSLLAKWSKDANSPILCLRIVGMKVVVISSYEFIKETFGKRADLSDRLEKNIFRVLDPTHDGIGLSSGQVWRDSRRVTLRRMRDLGMSTESGQRYITTEAEILMKKLDEFNGKPLNTKSWINPAVANVICGFAFGKRFDYRDPKFQKALECINMLNAGVFGPIAQFVLPFRVGRLIYKEKMRLLRVWWDAVTEFVDEQIEKHEENFDGTVSDLTNAFLADVRDGGGKFTRAQIRSNLIEMLIGGADTTVIQLQWLLLYMAQYQHVQDKVYEEIKKNIGNKLPSMNDKKNTPYTEATVNEVMRMNPLLFAGVPRTNNGEDFKIGGYEFKKGTLVIANYWAIHYDPEIFPNPEKFDPGHFLGPDGKTKNLDKMVSFSLGRRSCAGESLARIEIYLFFVMFVQRFRIRALEGTEVDFTTIQSAFHEPSDSKLRLIPRSQNID